MITEDDKRDWMHLQGRTIVLEFMMRSSHGKNAGNPDVRPRPQLPLLSGANYLARKSKNRSASDMRR